MQILNKSVDTEEGIAFLLAAMRQLEIFAAVPEDYLRKLIYFVQVARFEPDEVVFEKGAPGNAFFVIHTGGVEARTPGLLGDSVLSAMGPGEFFGELALILKQPRSATIVALEETVCFLLDTSDFERFMELNPELAAAIKDIARRRYDNSPG